MKIIMLSLIIACAGCTSYSPKEINTEVINLKSGQKTYLAYNIHHRGHEVRAANYQFGSIIPFGSEVELTMPFFSNRGRYQIKIVETGEVIYCRYNNSYNDPTIEEYFKRMLTGKDFKALSAGYSEEQLDCILAGMVVKGMTKKDVILSCGYPPRHRTSSIKNSTWIYWNSKFGTFKVVFNRKGKVIVGKPADNGTSKAFCSL